jgi:CRP-like cAMP-binding protein
VENQKRHGNTDNLNEYLIRINSFIHRLDNNVFSALNDLSKTKTYKKGEFLLRQDQVCRHVFTVKEGVLRKFYLNDGKEITTEFFFNDDVAISFESYSMQKPSKEYIQALTETVVSEMDYKAFQNAKNQFPKLVELDLLLTEYYVIWLERRLFHFHTLDATQRYLRLIDDQAHIVQNVPLTYIASYLGISLETLSRIRAKI